MEPGQYVDRRSATADPGQERQLRRDSGFDRGFEENGGVQVAAGRGLPGSPEAPPSLRLRIGDYDGPFFRPGMSQRKGGAVGGINLRIHMNGPPDPPSLKPFP
jgi:hypothetical protein